MPDPSPRRRSIRLAAWLLGASALVPALPAAAQETAPGAAAGSAAAGSAAAGGAMVLPEVNVLGRGESALDPVRGFVAEQQISGTKTDTPLIENPQSISVVPRDQIDARQAQTLGEALRYTAGVRGENYGSDSRTDWFQLRGFNAQDNGIFLNGLRYNTGYAGSVFETYGLERYEVLRGPTSVLYGQIAPGGLVNMMQRRPTDFATGEVRLTAGSFGRLQGQGHASGPLTADGQWLYGFTGLVRDSGTAVDEVDDDRIFLAPTLTWRPTADTSLTLLSYYQRDRTSGNQFLPYEGTVTETPFGRIGRSRFTGEQDFDRFDRMQFGVGYELSHRFNSVWSVQQNLRYGQTNIAWDQVYGGGLEADQRTLSRYAYRADIDVNTFQVDNQVKAQFTTGPVSHTVLGGFDFSQVFYRNAQQFAFASGLDVFNPTYGSAIPPLGAPYDNARQVNTQYGLYLQDQARIGNLVLLGGIRQDWAYSDIDDRDAGGVHSAQNNQAFTWRVGAVYLADSGLAPYVSYARSFQPQVGTDTSGVAKGWDPLKGEQYEAGIKFQPKGMRSFIQVAAFHLTQQNTLTPDPDNVFQQVSTGEIRVRGVEVEATAEIGRGVSLTGNYTYLDPEITESNIAAELGHRPAGVAKNNAGLYAEYSLASFAGPVGGLTVGAGVRFLGNTSAVNTGGSVVPSVTLFDAGLRYDLARLSESMRGLQFNVTASNLADTRYVSRCSGTAGCFYGNRLNVLGSLNYAW
ncbi:TonB-dependent siderophore receptor [Roseomonas sp. M0104]|uniref:TonB-dependent siderophore receptor n=1 Tax=Teichococcus coralli TaxID=2545983 RepID=A0A845BKN6_9PROT|nr:TonB-dependent siderophore receptor [Pseudoroseomonas coralli]MXP65722.1 TonB-dependent siderophore receptor [Pseudoroseomonas coralli]